MDGPPPPRLRLDDQLCFALYAATHAVQRAYRPLLGRIGLTYPQYLVMLVLWQDGERAITEIATRLSLPAHGVGPVVDRLAQAGLVSCAHPPQDRRVRIVSLTAAGARLQDAASVAQREVVCQTRLSDPQLRGLRWQLRALAEAMALDDDLVAPRPGASDGDGLSAEPEPEPEPEPEYTIEGAKHHD